MTELFFYIKQFGANSLDLFWFPILIWTVCCFLAFAILKTRKKLNPLFHYHLRTAALLSLPLGIGASALLGKIPEWFSSSNIETAFFVVSNPIEIVASSGSKALAQKTEWMELPFILGISTVLLLFVSLFMLVQLAASYFQLRTLYKNLELLDADEIHGLSYRHSNVKIAFHSHPLVPFTFGWKRPVIVLPEVLKQDGEKLQMALQHELVHIKRGDYLLQLLLSMIESLFWFHPFIRYANQEIDTYREISCDQEVLSHNHFSIKSYANLLYELVPLKSGAGKLSVSMAVQQSTLQKRLKTMKYHKLHTTSFKQSLCFLILMVIGITLPIACSDLRGSQAASYEELEQADLTLQSAKITINGINVNEDLENNASVTGLGAFLLNTQEHGIFKIAPRQFDGGIQSGNISDNTISFKLNQLDVEIISSSQILSIQSNSPVWVQHLPSNANTFTLQSLNNAESDIPPPPPSEFPSNKSSEKDYFVVVEQMPEPIGGIEAITSKIEYPDKAREAGIEGRVVVQFIVTENGDVEDARVVRGIGGGADEEALRVIREAKFTPGVQRGRNVRVQFALSINFDLSDTDL